MLHHRSRRFHHALGSVAVLALCASVGVAANAATSSAAPAAPAAASGALVRSPLQAPAKAWTAEALQQARPMPMPQPRAGAHPTSGPARATGAPGVDPGSGLDQTSAEPADAPVSVGPTSGSFTYPTPFDRYNLQGALYKAYPHKTVGKLFFTQNGGSFVCSASSIGNDAIWTAGHCVSDGAGHFSTNMVFVPAYKSGNAPYGQFSCNAIITFSAWHNSGDLSRDSGGASCGTSSKGNGKTVSQAVGYLGFAWNQPSDSKHYTVLGYPQAAPFTGALQVVCSSSFGHYDQRSGFNPNTFAVGCDSTGGVSGGPYVINYSPTAGASDYLNGNASYKYTNPAEPLELYTPYFDSSSKVLKDALVS